METVIKSDIEYYFDTPINKPGDNPLNSIYAARTLRKFFDDVAKSLNKQEKYTDDKIIIEMLKNGRAHDSRGRYILADINLLRK